MTSAPRPVARYAVALVCAAVAILVRLVMDPALLGSLPLVTLFPAVGVAVWFGGEGPAIVTALIGYVAADFLFIEPRGGIGIKTIGDVVGIVAYLSACAVLVGFGEGMRRARQRADASVEEVTRERDRAERQTEAAVREREWFRTTVASVGDGVIATDTQGRVTFLNAVAQFLTGWTPEDAGGVPLSTVFRIVNETTREVVDNPAARVLREGVVVGLGNHTTLIAKDGTERPIDDSAAPIKDSAGNVSGVVLVFRDASERRRLEALQQDLQQELERQVRERTAELAQSEERFRLLVEGTRDYAIFLLDPDGHIVSWNPGAEHLKGYTAREIIGQHFSRFYTPEDLRSGKPDRELQIARAEGRYEEEGWRVRKDGSRFWASVLITALHDDAGRPRGFSKITRDLTAKREAEDRALRLSTAQAALQEAERGAAVIEAQKEQLRTTLQSIGDAVITTDAKGRVKLVNRVARTLTGWTEAEAAGQPLDRVFIIRNEMTGETVENPVERVLREGIIVGLANHTILIARDGATRPIDDSAAPIRDPQGNITGVVLVFRDVTERRAGERARRARLAVAQILAHETSVLQAASRIVQAMGESLAWDVGGLWLVDPKERVLRCGTFWKSSTAHADEFTTLSCGTTFAPGQGLPGRVWSAGAPVWVPDVTREGNFTRAAAAERAGLHAALAFPIGSAEEIFGVIELYSRPIRAPDPDLLEVATILGGQFGQFMGRQRTERTARFLADASASLAAIGDVASTLQKVAGLAVPFFADWCTVDLLGPDGGIRRVATAHIDPSKIALANELGRRFPPDPKAPQGTWQILRTGKSEIVPEITEELLAKSIPDPELLGIVRELGLHSYLGVPLCPRGKPVGVVTFVAAESRRRYNAADLAVAEDLAHRVSIAMENADLYAELRDADRKKDEFIAILSHELRNPLAPLRNAVEILKRRDGDSPVTKQAVSVMDRQLSQMIRLVDDLLEMGRITRNQPDLRKEPIALGAVVEAAVETSRPLIEERGHTLTVNVPAESVLLDADPTRLPQVFANLLNNAAKYTEPGGHIWLTAAREGSDAVVSVKDSGIGIAREMLPKVFDMFTRVDQSMARSPGGLGIGLTLVKRLVELHGGHVEARSEGEGRGSEFIVRLPLAPLAASAPPARRPGMRGPPIARRILVVDDNEDAARSLEMVLQLGGNDTRTAFDGEAALVVAETFRPNVVLLDIGLPGLNGYETCRRLREVPWGRDIVVIALTGWGQPEDKRRSKEAGFDFHMTKPVDPAALEELLATLPQPR